MTELERALEELGGRLELPPAPDLAPRVLARLEGAAPPARPRRRSARALALAFAFLLVAVGTAFAVPQSRHAILDWLGLEGVTVERVVTLPEAPAAASLRLGERLTLAEAEERVTFPVLVPAALGPPPDGPGAAGVFVDETVPGAMLSLVYPATGATPGVVAGAGLLVGEFRGDLAPELLGKLVASSTAVEEVAVGGLPGLWIEGGHVLFYRDPAGDVREETVRLAGNVLLFERDGVLVRLESRLAKDAAVRLAESLEPARSTG